MTATLTMMTLNPSGSVHTSTLTAVPKLSALQEGVGGYIEAVPYFEKIEHDGAWHDCVAFCDEEGKLKGKEVNVRASMLWARSLRKQTGSESMDDVLVGPIVVLFGDKELMAQL